MSNQITRLFAALFAAAVLPFASGQTPPGSAAPSQYVDLGDIGLGQVVESGDKDLAAGLYVWFRFNLLVPISPDQAWLDIDTLGPNIILNNQLALYDAQKNRIAIDNDSGGSGTAGNNFAAAMSFGSGSGKRLSLSPPGGVISDGLTGTTLPPGVYWACIGAYPTTFPDPNNNWDTTTSSTTSGKVRIKISTGAKPSSLWNERHNNLDAGGTPNTAAVVAGKGDLKTILTSYGAYPKGVDIFKIRICDPANFSVVAEATSTDNGGGGNYGSRLYLFDASGKGLLGINRGSQNTTRLTTIPSVPLAVGDYFVAVSSDCGGDNGMWAVPYSASGPLWDFGAAGNNSVLKPNGPGASGMVVYWGRQQNCYSADVFVVSLTLSGCCYVGSDCSGDLNGDSLVNDEDFSEFVVQYDRLVCP